MKKSRLIGLLLILSIGFSLACGDNQIILRLSSINNAHGAIWNQTAYSILICYDNIFGSQYTGANPHSCSGSNKVLKLSSETNAHAEIPSLNNYNIDVCYGDLICEARTSCQADEKLIVSLSANTNAHLANDSSYPVKICCKIGAEISQAYWANMNDNPISQADLKDFVKLIVSGYGLEEINYTIYKDVAWWFDKKIAISSSRGELIWQAGKKSDGSFSSGEYYFVAKLIDGSSKTSGNLNVAGIEKNTPPTAGIVKPIDRQIYFLNEQLFFNHSSYDLDDSFFSYKWSLGDGIEKAGNTSTKENYNFVYVYTTPGQKNIVLEVTDARGKTSIARASILVVSSPYVLSYIDAPDWGDIVRGFNVSFDAKSSYAVDYNSVNKEISCLGGFCPLKTQGCPGENPVYPNCQLTVQNAPPSINSANYSSLNFRWNFDDGKSYSGVNKVWVTHHFDDWTKLSHRVYLNVSLAGGI